MWFVFVSLLSCSPAKIVKEDVHSYAPEPNIPEILRDFVDPYESNPAGDGQRYDWFAAGQDELELALRYQHHNTGVAKNVIIFIGDGLGITTQTAARIMKAQESGLTGSQGLLEWEKFPHMGMSRTYAVNEQVSSSAETATALMAGVKARNGVIGLNWDVPRSNCELSHGNEVTSALTYAHLAGKSTGVVSDARITHATPAAAYAHVPTRSWESSVPSSAALQGCKDIAAQLVEDNGYIQVVLGGGRREFYPETTRDVEDPSDFGERQDGRNLVQEWLDARATEGMAEGSYQYVWNDTTFRDIDPEQTDYVLGLFNPSHMEYEENRPNDIAGEPSLAEMVDKAIRILKKNDNGFFLQVEGGRIDHAHHSNRAFRALNNTLAMSDAVKVARQLTSSDDTLIIVTADHSHPMGFNGYPDVDEPILGIGGRDANGFLYTTLSYTNGPGWYIHRDGFGEGRWDLTNVDTLSPIFNQDGAIPFSSETHAGEDVAIYASGPMSHLIHRTHEQSYIAHVMMYAACIGPNLGHCQQQ